jgi:GNAT superfamily N-acetyltransferase
MTFIVRVMERADLNTAVAWAEAEGWNPGKHDADAFFAADPKGYFIGEREGRPISCISAVAYGSDFGFIGFYIVHPDYRGQGYGLQTWNRAMNYLAGRNVGLDGVTAQQENYAKSGFRLAYRNMRFQGQGGGEIPQGLTELSCLPFAQIRDYDRRFFPSEREAFLQRWLALPESVGLGVVESGALKGYGIVRACPTGYKIGPLFADTEEIAERIFQGLSGSIPESPLFLDIPEPNSAASALVERHAMTFVFETARMYTGAPPSLPLAQLFGVTTFELG